MEKKKVNIKDIVKEKYGEIARQSKEQNETSCCGSGGCCGDVDYTIFSDDYSKLQGYNPEADLGLGCGIPTQFANIKKGDSVLDLGSGAGNDCFVARSIVGEKGKVTGLDFTDEMIRKANTNLKKVGFSNVRFVKGDIEEMPFGDNQFDVIVSNCVINLVPDKNKAFTEMFRVLRPGGHFCISDVVITGDLPESIKQQAEMYAGCVSGAIQKEEYLKIIEKIHFTNISIKKEKQILIPNEILQNYLSVEELKLFNNSEVGIFSITVFANK
ncbi:MAG: arsenite methyltransferase [Bacteroidota bacterium]|nr:arsenite methyltransferase [Bacteroidota bacterium]